MVTPKQLQRAVMDLQQTRPGPGFRHIAQAIIAGGLGIYLLMQPALPALLFGFILLVLAYTALMVVSHDALHHTLTGIKWFDRLFPYLYTWPVLWPHATYSALHRFHHKMNGDDPRDPERLQYFKNEYERSSTAKRWYVRNQWFLHIFVWGGFGYIIQNYLVGWRFAQISPSIRRAMSIDVLGTICSLTLIHGVACYLHCSREILIVWLALERGVGGLLQMRALVEHYGLHGKGSHYFETQILNSRNVHTNFLGRWLFNYLCFHSVHHAFPKVPFYQLEEATQRIGSLYAQHGNKTLPFATSYLRITWHALHRMELIEDPVQNMLG